MSTYRPDSEISRFNRSNDPGAAFAVSADFLQVMNVAGRLYRLSDGAWDGTVYPLVSLWGFGAAEAAGRVPSEAEIQDLLPRVGFDKIRVSPSGFLSKTVAGVTLDLASIAKGFGVDQVAAVVREAGVENYLVEIGGEVYAAGRRADGRRWRIGINRPSARAPLNAVYRVVELQDRAFATSGDYRNFFVYEGVRYSHVIDPRTGRPVANGVVSVSVVSDTCTLADGLATAVMVMGPRAGVDLVERIPNTECLVVIETPQSGLRDIASSGFRSIAP
jgi:thiamine biosynthesis lipoprotein